MQRKNTVNLARAMGFLMAAAFLISVALLGRTLYESFGQKKKADELVSLYERGGRPEASAAATAEGGEAPADWSRGMLDINSDYFGWLTVYGTQVDYPVVQGEDNSYYLSHDFYGKPDIYGSLFLDSGNDLSADGNLLVYGHFRKDGQMFGSLGSFKNADFFAENGLVRLDTQSGVSYYEIFALLIIPGSAEASDYLPLQEYLNRPEEEAAARMMEILKNRAYFYKDLAIEAGGRFLFLVTCDYTRTNGRLLLCAKRV